MCKKPTQNIATTDATKNTDAPPGAVPYTATELNPLMLHKFKIGDKWFALFDCGAGASGGSKFSQKNDPP